MPELRHLRYFLAVAAELNFTRAAARVGVTQQVLSAQVKQLEDELGGRLFDRDTRTVALTDGGRALAERAGPLYDAVETLWEDTRRMARGEHGVVRLGFWRSAVYDTAPRLLAALEVAYPSVEVQTVELAASQLPVALRDQRIDVALARWTHDTGDLFFEDLRYQRTGVVVRADDALTDRDDVTLVQLVDRPLVMPDRTTLPARFDAVLAACAAAGFAPRLVKPRLEFDPAFTDVADNRGIVLATESVAAVLPTRLRWLPLADDTLRETIRVLWNPSRSSPIRDALIAVARRVAAEQRWLDDQ